MAKSNTEAAVLVKDPSCANWGAYIYLLVGIVEGYESFFVYVGQTAGALGFLGRLAHHLSEGAGATFRARLCQLLRYEEIRLKEVAAFWMRLPPESHFTSKAPDFREAVEYAVQSGLIGYISQESLGATVVSRVTSNGYSELKPIKEIAVQILAEFQKSLQASASDMGA